MDNKNFQCVFLKFIFFKLADGISQVLVDLKFGDLHLMCFCRMNHEFQNLMFFSISGYHRKDEKHKENRYLNFKMLPFF